MLLTEFCTRLPELRRLLRGPRRAEFERTVLAARNGEPVDAQLEKLGVGSGIRARVTEVYGPSAGVTGAYLCPGGQCARVVYRAAGEDLPTCPLFERDLRFVADG